jgi:cyclopropane fatty-acyl-phospholipid synthase-like methyltransferase
MTTTVHGPIGVIEGPIADAYQERVVSAYGDSPQDWRRAIGDGLWFQFGVYDNPRSPHPVSLDEAGMRYFERQLGLAGFGEPDGPPVGRALDLGCGWGGVLAYLAGRFPECGHLDGVNVSRRQLDYGARLHSERGLSERVHLYECNAQDIDLLPGAQEPYDLAVMRGVISHFPDSVYEAVMHKLRRRVRRGGTVVVSDNLYNGNLGSYVSDTLDTVDRLACGHRKTPEYFREVATRSGFSVRDMRVLPSNADAVRWLLEIRASIERNFPQGVTGALEELRVMCESLAVAIVKNKMSVYSAILTRD